MLKANARKNSRQMLRMINSIPFESSMQTDKQYTAVLGHQTRHQGDIWCSSTCTERYVSVRRMAKTTPSIDDLMTS